MASASTRCWPRAGSRRNRRKTGRREGRKRRVRPSSSFAFARKANSLYLASAEFGEASKGRPFLRNALDFLGRYQQEYRRTESFCRRLEQAGLLTEMNAKADLVDGRSFTLGGLLVVDDKKLLALPDAVALSLFRAGELHLISLHLASLPNLKRLVDRMAERKPTLQPAPRPA